MTTKRNIFGRILVGIAVGLTVTCSGTTTQTLLDAEYLASGQSQIALISPLDNVATTQNPVLSWGEKSGIAKYLVEISPVADFSTLVLSKEVKGSSYVVSNSDLMGITQLDAVQYYWRVSAAKLKNNLRSNPNSIQVLETNTYYVNVGSTASTQVGNKTAPFKVLQDAIGAGVTLRNGNSANFVTVRVAAGTYPENITLKPGISLYGGYNAADWSRNISANTTNINAQATTAVFAGSDITSTLTATTIVDGFTIKGGSSSAFQNFGVYINSSAPTISNNTIIGGNSAGNKSCGLFIDTGSNPALSGNSISGGNGTTAYGVQLSSASYTLSNNTISSGTGTTLAHAIEITGSGTTTVSGNTITTGSGTTPVYGISVVGTGAVVISGNTINGGNSTSNQYGIQANPTGGSLAISGNTISMGTTAVPTYGIYGSVNFGVTISNNTISAKGTNVTYAIYTSSTVAWTISGNNVHGGIGSNPIGIYLSNSPSVVINNFIHGGAGSGGAVMQGIFCGTCAAAIVTNNTINAGQITGSGTAAAIFLSGSNTMSITNNIMYSTSTVGSRYGVQEGTATSYPTSFHNNVIFDTPTGPYWDQSAAIGLTLQVDLNDYTKTTANVISGAAGGNMGPAVVTNFAAVNFASASDLHLTASTPLNIRCGGKNTATTVCGNTSLMNCGNVTNDFDAILRTASVAGTCTGVSNPNAAGYSIGAYEKD